jgi:hypothetical protein
MGQICSGQSTEPTKKSAFSDNYSYYTNDSTMQVVDATPKDANTKEAPRDTRSDREKALREEQARLERLVTLAGREMVAVRSTRGGSYYNDQGFAAALAQHLEQTITSVSVDKCLPRSQGQLTYSILSRPVEKYPNMDAEAESILSSVVPAKERLFAGCKPLVENLL